MPMPLPPLHAWRRCHIPNSLIGTQDANANVELPHDYSAFANQNTRISPAPSPSFSDLLSPQLEKLSTRAARISKRRLSNLCKRTSQRRAHDTRVGLTMTSLPVPLIEALALRLALLILSSGARPACDTLGLQDHNHRIREPVSSLQQWKAEKRASTLNRGQTAPHRR